MKLYCVNVQTYFLYDSLNSDKFGDCLEYAVQDRLKNGNGVTYLEVVSIEDVPLMYRKMKISNPVTGKDITVEDALNIDKEYNLYLKLKEKFEEK